MRIVPIFFRSAWSNATEFVTSSYFRYPAVTVGNLVAQLLSLPLGRLAARIFPDVKIFGARLNPGPFTIKEHVLVTIMASVGWQSAYATDIIAVQRVFYNQQWNFSCELRTFYAPCTLISSTSFRFLDQWLMVMSTQLIGFSMGGVTRRFLVTPPSMIWPANLVFCALFNTLHSNSYAGIGDRGGISRERFFFYVFIAGFVWYIVPG